VNAPRHYGHDGDTSLLADANGHDNDHNNGHDEEASDDEVIILTNSFVTYNESSFLNS
jgi:hypothetical protein